MGMTTKQLVPNTCGLTVDITEQVMNIFILAMCTVQNYYIRVYHVKFHNVDLHPTCRANSRKRSKLNCGPLRENPALCANIEFELEPYRLFPS